MSSVTFTFEDISKMTPSTKAELMALISRGVGVHAVDTAETIGDLLDLVPSSEVVPEKLPSFTKIRLPNGNFVGYHKGIKQESLADVEESKAQIFKTVLISEGPHTGCIEFEAVGGHHHGKVLDNSAQENKLLIFYKRTSIQAPNRAQRWMVKGGKIASVVEGNLHLAIKEGGRALFTYSEQGSLFTFVATEPPAISLV
jgi:hypothetical protein